MSTCVFYIDEAGSTRGYSVPIQPERGETAIFALFSLVFPLADWRDFDRDYLRLKLQFFKAEISRSSDRPEHWEVKGNELCSPHNRDSHRRHAFLRQVLDLCERYRAEAFAVTFVKDHLNPMSSEARYCMAMQYLAERFNVFLVESRAYDQGIVIADKRMDQLDFNVASSYLSYLFGHHTGRLLTRLAESPLFADSRLTAGLQITDNVASALFANHYHYYCGDVPGAPDYSHVPPRYWDRLNSLQFRSREQYDGFLKYGFKVCDHRPVAQ